MPKPSTKASKIERIKFGEGMMLERTHLANGLRIYLLVDRSAPVVSYQTWFRVGSRHEKKGKTGLAHLFEHLMFNETKHLPAGEFDRKLESAGGETNAATWVDWTFYYENVPASELSLVIELEAERMGNLILRDKQVRSEKEVVANERRFRVEDDVEGATNERLYATAFTKHPYRWPTIGWMRDIKNFTTSDCRAFYETYYAPNNATIVAAGDLDPKKVLAEIGKRYGKLPAAKIPAERVIAEPPQRGERRVEIVQPTTTDKVQIGYHAPSFAERDHAVLTVLNEILFGGRSSRVTKKLVLEEEIAADARGSVAPFAHAGLYDMWLSGRDGHGAKELLRALDRLLAEVGESITAAELDKAKNRLELSFLQGIETASGKAEQVGFYDTVVGDPVGVFTRLEWYRTTTLRDLHRVAKAVLDKKRRSVVIVRAKNEAEAAQ